MEFKGTKGDWFITESWTNTQIELGTQEQSCIALFEKDWFRDEEEFKANIALIKHSKEMLEMLKQILKESEIDIIQGLDKNKVRNLIKKATTV